MTALLFDFFGTLVSYSPSRTAQGYPRTHALMCDTLADPSWPYARFVASIDACYSALDRAADLDDHEYSMTTIASAYLSSVLGHPPSAALVAAFERTYLEEWSSGVEFLDGLDVLVKNLRSRHRLAVVSNTHSRTMVPDLLSRMGIAPFIEATVLSVDLGWRKPHPAVYRTVLDRLGITPADAVFIGDSYAADYAGPVAAGIPAFLIDPGRTADIPADRRLGSVFDLPARLAP
jgi:putative hydrolase of the HAD superfamily